ncbi:MAG: hypothetical protein NTW15_05150 [Burkholderiales bacterium]|nr:hypothetical protein [Burkholderiales bacterium]
MQPPALGACHPCRLPPAGPCEGVQNSYPPTRVGGFLSLAKFPSHLREGHDSEGRLRIDVVSESLVPDARAARERLLTAVGQGTFDRLLDAVLLGREGEEGLMALIGAWRAARGFEALRGRIILDLANVITNLPAGDALHDLEHMAGFRSGAAGGIYLTTESGERNVEFVGGLRSENGYVVDMIDSENKGKPLLSPPGAAHVFAVRVRDYDMALSDPSATGRMPPEVRRWMPDRAAFVDAFARLEALKLALGHGGMSWRGVDLNDSTTTRWGQIASRFPSIDDIDFVAAYPRAYADMRRVIERSIELDAQLGHDLF